MNAKVLDIEFDGEPWDGVLLAVGWGDTAYKPDEVPADVQRELADPSIGKITFTKADHRWLTLAGWDLKGPLYDVQVQCWAIDETTDLSLEHCVKLYLDEDMDKRIKRVGKNLFFTCDDGAVVPLRDAPWDQLKAYNERDLGAAKRLFYRALKLLYAERVFDYWERECVPLGSVLVGMETRGMPVDVDAAATLCERLESEMKQYDYDLHHMASLPDSFNLSSDKQMREYLFTGEVRIPDKFAVSKEQIAYYKAGFDIDWLGIPDQNKFTLEKIGRIYASGYYSVKGRRLRVHKHTEKGAASTDSKTLLVHFGDDPWIAKLLELRKRETVVTTFLRPIPERAVPSCLDCAYNPGLCDTHKAYQNGHRLYGMFNQTGTKTGRLSSSKPNLQNQPARGDLGYAVRSLFVAPEGKIFVHGDYSMLEPRLQAHWSQDPQLLRIFREDRDIYLETAKMIFGREFTKEDRERALMKTYILAMGYGAQAPKLREVLAEAGFPTPLAEVEATLIELMNVYSTFFKWKEDTIEEANRTRYVLTLAGHKRHLGRDTNAKGWRDIGTGSRQAVNSIIQGSAADVVNRTMVGTQQLPMALLVQVHDEMLWEAIPWQVNARVLKNLQRIAEVEHRFKLSVPLKFEPKVVTTWAEGKAA